VALSRTERRRAFLRSLAFAAALAGAAPALAEPPAAASSVAPAAGPASRWALPPANVAMRSAMLGGSSAMERVLVSQRSIEPVEPAMPALQVTWPDAPADAFGSPNLFGSIALAVSHTPLDAEWTRASAARPLVAWTGGFSRVSGDNREAVLGEVNRWVNERIRFSDDRNAVGRTDRWSGAAETLRRGTGDCEDYALTKMQLLAALGFETEDMYLVVVRDTVRLGDHAVLAVRLGERFVILDNLHADVVDSVLLPQYRPVISYSSAGRWVHGFPAAPQRPVRMASLAGAAAP
jgi:predicted transglutaminase-like cysteine proteinase